MNTRIEKPGLKFFIALFVILLSFLVFAILGAVLGIFIFDINIFDTVQHLDYSDPAQMGYLKFTQIMYSLGTFMIPPFIIGYYFTRNSGNYLKLNKAPDFKIVILSISSMLIALPLISFLGNLNEGMQLPSFLSGIEEWMRTKEDATLELTQSFLKTTTSWGFIVNILMIGIIPGIGEELLFRGVIQPIFSEWTKSVHWGVIISAFIFAALHLQFYGFLPRFLMGVYLGYLFVWTRNLWVPIAAHFINNIIAVLAYFIYRPGDAVSPENIVSAGDSYLMTAISTVLFTVLVVFIYRYSKITNFRVKQHLNY